MFGIAGAYGLNKLDELEQWSKGKYSAEMNKKLERNRARARRPPLRPHLQPHCVRCRDLQPPHPLATPLGRTRWTTTTRACWATTTQSGSVRRWFEASAYFWPHRSLGAGSTKHPEWRVRACPSSVGVKDRAVGFPHAPVDLQPARPENTPIRRHSRSPPKAGLVFHTPISPGARRSRPRGGDPLDLSSLYWRFYGRGSSSWDF